GAPGFDSPGKSAQRTNHCESPRVAASHRFATRRRESPLRDEAPELLLVEEGDPLSLLAKPLDLHELQARVASGGLEGIGAPANDDARPRRRPAVDDRSGAIRGAGRFLAGPPQDPGEGEVDAP